MKTRNILHASRPLLLAVALGGCSAAPRTATEERPAPTPTPAQVTQAAPTEAAPPAAVQDAAPTPAPEVVRRPPAPAEVRAALERTYRGAVAFDERAPRAAVGDFNGDGSEDLIVETRPADGRLAELNDELANWIVYDPLTVRSPDPRDFDPHQGVQKHKPREGRPRVEPGEGLLVVLHGHGEGGWRSPEAQQTFLLKNVAGTDLRAQPPAEARATALRKTPRLRGDVLREKLGGGGGFLYWTGAGYGWWGDAEETGQNRLR
ncbi:MAG TPA: hypothetical protein VF588_20015 [Pyrinomonadaceae bacterium]|jgi:hypothetical protein